MGTVGTPTPRRRRFGLLATLAFALCLGVRYCLRVQARFTI